MNLLARYLEENPMRIERANVIGYVLTVVMHWSEGVDVKTRGRLVIGLFGLCKDMDDSDFVMEFQRGLRGILGESRAAKIRQFCQCVLNWREDMSKLNVVVVNEAIDRLIDPVFEVVTVPPKMGFVS
jgi:hypothetical protein